MKKQSTIHWKFQSFFQFLLIGLFLLLAQQGMATIYYVNAATGSNGNSGTSWATAFKNVQKALSVVSSGDEIWVAEGTYYPDEGPGVTNNDKNASFEMVDGVAIYGGFPNSGNPVFADRDWVTYETILSGDVGTVNNDSDNSYHVIFNVYTNLDDSAILDGFIVTKGNANGISVELYGGGMYNNQSSPKFVNCTFEYNKAALGGGIYNQDASPAFENCIFSENEAGSYGGGMYNSGSIPTLTYCTFSENSASRGGGMYNTNSSDPSLTFCDFNENTATFGGGIYNNECSPDLTNCNFIGNASNGASGGGIYNTKSTAVIINCSFIGNSADYYGGGINNQESTPEIINCSFSGNSANVQGGAMFNSDNPPKIRNCIFWGNSSEIENSSTNPTVRFSIVQGGYPGNGNLDTDPLFLDQPPIGLGTSGDLRLSECSPAMDAGNNSFNLSTEDLDMNPRIDISFGSETIDMGAYEYQNVDVCICVYGTNRLYVNENASGENDGSSWTDAFTDLQDALEVANNCTDVAEIWVAAGTYKPTSSTNRNVSFEMRNNLGIYGGFAGGETNLNDRDWAAYPTILSGDIGTLNDLSDNSFHVIENDGLDPSAILDGFQITAGNANGNGSYLQKLGGGLYNDYSSPTISNCIFHGNKAAWSGGGMYNNFSTSPIITNCVFSGNEAENGGAMYNYKSSPDIKSCSFSGNNASQNGGGMYNNDAAFPVLTNCIVWGNSNGIKNAAYNQSKATVKYSIIQGGHGGTGNLKVDPLFVAQPNYEAAPSSTGDLRLQSCSPAIDAGDNSANNNTFDLDHNTRLVESISTATIDMGAYEYQSTVNICNCFYGSGIVYVDQNASGLNNGSNWTDAFTDLQDALAQTNECANITEIWVAAGTYLPTTDNDRNISFQLKDNLAIYGGFAGGETIRNQRDWAVNTTILSGDIGTVDDRSDNSFHVVFNNEGQNGTAILNGFTIMDGNANGNNNVKKRGGGIYNDSGTSPSIVNCIVKSNRASQHGGGMYNADASSPSVSNCIFSGNLAAIDGGGIYNTGSSPTVNSCSFSGNKANSDGGGMYNAAGSTPTLINCILWGNNSEIENSSDSNPTVQYSIVKGGYTGTGNLDADPFFVDQPGPGSAPSPAGDLRLQMCSGAIDTGDNTSNNATKDLDGNPRLVDATGINAVDMGAYEFQGIVDICICDYSDNILYVDENANGNNDGSSWEDAYNDLQDALILHATCPNVIEIWVAAGTYKPTPDANRNVSFELRNNLAIYGGFAGGENNVADRDWIANMTILSGDIGTLNDDSDNNFHVVFNNNSQKGTAILDGFTIRDGNANGNTSTKKNGGGMYNINASPTINNCIFLDNACALQGGGMYNNNSSPIITNSTFIGNMANEGGGMFNLLSSALTVTNCLFSGNYSQFTGGGMSNLSSPSILTNCTFSGNSASLLGGGGLFTSTSNPPTLANCIFWGNSSEIEGTATVTYSIVQGGYTGTGNSSYNPLFVDQPDYNNAPTTAGNLRLQECSPAIDSGDDTANSTTSDLDSNPRIVNATGTATIDIGAYEYQSLVDVCACLNGNNILFVNLNANGQNNGLNWTDAYTDLQDALAIVETCSAITEIWVATGTYKPTSGSGRGNSFEMQNNLAIYGGFAGTETSITQRNWVTNETTLSGDIGSLNDNVDNSFHVIFNDGNNLNNTAILDGFTISGGNANGSHPHNRGGGMHNDDSSPTVINCSFKNNSSGIYGGGVYNRGSASPTFTNCIFSGNNSNTLGGGMYNSNTSPILTNCSFSGNNSSSSGGGMYNSGSASPSITNCIFWGNSSEISGPATVTYSIVKGGRAGIGNLNKNPQFVSQPPIGLGTSGNLRLQDCSPAIDNGDNASSSSNYDLDGNTRIINSTGTETIDMGAYEFPNSINLCTCTSGVAFVDEYATGNNNGLNWENAYVDLQDALAFASTCINITEIWVAAGTYKPTPGTDRGISFEMQNNLAIYGGFAGSESNLNQRDWEVNVTTLSGDIGIPIDNSDNSYHVVLNKNNGLDNTAILDGFTISAGHASGFSGDTYWGGGMLNESSSPQIENCIFSGNIASYSGGGMSNNSASPTILNCSFIENMATLTGGGMHNDNASPQVTNCVFSGNEGGSAAGGMHNTSSSPTVINSIFIGNLSPTGGGMLNEENSSTQIINCSFSGNDGSAIFNNNADPTIINCIVWGNNSGITNGNSNPIVQYSIVQGGHSGTGNLNTDPFFVSQPPIGLGTSGDLRLQGCSPAIDAGDNTANNTSTDLDGNTRIKKAINTSTIDMGAYEYQSTVDICACIGGNILYVNQTANGLKNGRNWTDAFPDLQDALALAKNCNVVTEIWVATGIYKPTSGTGRGISFKMKNNLAIYGGFAGVETNLSQRDWIANETTLSGDIGTQNDRSDNSFHVVFNNSGLNGTAVLDGFTIMDGNANGNNYLKKTGGGMYNDSNSSPRVTHCKFIGNRASDDGGAMFNKQGSSPIVTNCIFRGNLSGDKGGAMFNNHCAPTINSCSFSGNKANPDGGGMYNFVSSPTITNCILWGNSSEIKNFGGANPSVQYSIVKGGYAGTGNLNVNPLFIDQPNPDDAPTIAGDLHLQECSPAIDAGTNTGAPNIDLDGNARPVHTGYDMGAFEFQNAFPLPIASCQSITKTLDAAGQVTVQADEIEDDNSSGCGTLTFLIDGETEKTFDCSDIETPPQVTLTVTDKFNVSSTCTATITIEDNIFPTALCKPHTVQLDVNGNGSLTGNDIDGGSTDACGIASLSASPNAFDCSHIGANTVTLTVTDNHGNESTCTVTVTVEDTVLPTALCKNETANIGEDGSFQLDPVNINDGSSDACGIANMSVSPQTLTCNDIGQNTITLTVTDNNGNVNTCTATVTVQDVELPIASCQPHTVQLDASGSGSLSISDIDDGSSDNCGIASLAASPNTFDCSNIGPNNVTLTVTDVSGNENTCTATVTVEDKVQPAANCKPFTLQLDADGNGNLFASDVDDGSGDACGNATTAVAPNTFSCLDVGSNTVTLTVTDNAGNVNSCTTTVTVEDKVQPTAFCQTHTVQLDADGNGSLMANDIDDGSADACGIASLSAAPNVFDCSHTGNNPITLTVTDNNGNVNICTATVTVEDNVQPTAICQPYTVQLDASGNGSLSANDIDNGSSDACSVSILASPNTFDCSNIGPNNVTLTVTDVSGNENTCTATVTVEDKVQPAANCKPFTLQLDADGNGNLFVSDVDDGSGDACGNTTITVAPNTFSCSDVGSNTVTLTVTDNAGNVNFCTTTVTVEDNVQPTAFCQTHTVQLDADGNGSLTANDIDDGSADACGIASLSAAPNVFECSHTGNNTITLTVIDNSGNVNTCTANITVEDNVQPTANCQTHTVQLDASGNGNLSANDIDDGSMDACGVAALSVSPNAFNCSDIGTNSVILTVTDNNGNMNTCNASVTVEDNILPAAVCKSYTIQLDASGNGSLTANDIDGGSTDACGIASLNAATNTFDCVNIGSNNVTLTVTDNNSKVNTCTATVIVEDQIDPVPACKTTTVFLDANGSYQLTESDVFNGGSDNCGGVFFQSMSPNTVSCADHGQTISVVVTANDGNGNTADCSATITVEDNTAPVPNCLTTTVFLGNNGIYDLQEADVLGTSSDNCGGIFFQSMNPIMVSCAEKGQTITIIVTTNDGNGNTATCSANITVEDNEVPVAVCPATNPVVVLDANGSGTLPANIGDGSSTDNCSATESSPLINLTCTPGTHTVTLTVSDGLNSSSVDCTFNVIDNIAPVATCPVAIADVLLDANGNGTLPANIGDGSSTDNCTALETSPTQFYTCSDIGVQTVVLTADDGNGNSDTKTCSFNVVDNGGLTITCPANVIRECDQSNSSVWTGVATATDNCTAVSNITISESDASTQGTSGCDYYSYTITRTWTADDGNGNMSSCDQIITVVDNTGPSITCPAAITVECDTDHSPANTGNATAVDNCDTQPSITSSDATTAGSCSQEWIITRTWTATDACGNSAPCDQVITVEDTTAPTITCPADVTIECDEDTSPANTGSATAFDNCGGANISHNDATGAGECTNGATITRTWSATDDCNNPTSCEQVITIEDNTGPSITCPANVTVECDEDTSPANTGSATAVDNCGGGSITSSDAVVAGSCENASVITRTWTATDDCGNPASCDQTITVEDTTGPVMACGTLTVTLNGDGNYTLSQTEIDGLGAGTLDNCGTVAFSASPNTFDCADDGANTVAITGTDECGNQNSCSATVTVEAYLTIVSCNATGETCTGAADGKIDISATAPSGQVKYSIDGGSNFSANGNFANLIPGTYNIVVKLFGIGEICEKTDTRTVDAGPAPTVWHKDSDGDGYSDGNTLTSCTQPTGYIANPLTGNDCNDSDPAINPGATEACNGLDDDCDGIIPADEADADGDGYMLCEGDCDDTDPGVNPGATEICNGIDDDCDGEIDEGVGSGLTWTGNVTFTTQAEVDAWLACYSIIDGNLSIMGGGITDLSNLIGLEEVTGLVFIYGNGSLISLDGLDNLATVGNGLSIYYNFALADCCAISDLLENGGITGTITIFANATGCDSEAEIIAECGGSNLMSAPIKDISDAEQLEILKQNSINQVDLSLFPNPASSKISVLYHGLDSNNSTIKISDYIGRTVLLKKVDPYHSEPIRLNILELPAGIYHLTWSVDGLPLQTKKFVKIKE